MWWWSSATPRSGGPRRCWGGCPPSGPSAAGPAGPGRSHEEREGGRPGRPRGASRRLWPGPSRWRSRLRGVNALIHDALYF